MFDLKITGGKVVDGTGRAPFVGDIAIKDGKIVEVGDVQGDAKEIIDASGCIVTPGFVDIHTHYDGQISWDEELKPSSIHGVTTCVLGNCGVGFAPVHPEDREALIALMEGVEDIPGTALWEGIDWQWESFPEYMDALEKTPRAIDYAVQVPHDALRVYVMRERGLKTEVATDDDIEKMSTLLKEALQAGAIGFSTGRSDNHRAASGDPTPAHEVTRDELVGLAKAFHAVSHGVISAVSDFDMMQSPERFDPEFDLLEEMAVESKRTVSVTTMQRDQAAGQWRQILNRAEAAEEKGLSIRLQTAPRPIGVILGLDATFHPLVAFPSYQEIAHLPLEERVKLLRDPDRRAKILSETPVKISGDGSSVPPLADILLSQLEMLSMRIFRLGASPDYEPDLSTSIGAQARASGTKTLEALYDALLERDGHELLYFPVYNYTEGSLDNVHTMMTHPQALPGLTDGGAHVGTICDASFPSFLLSYWTRDRAEKKIPLEEAVQMLTQRTARYLGLNDRGELAVGKRADINVIDYDNLSLEPPTLVPDLPGGHKRLMQYANGYRATFVGGEMIVQNNQLTGKRPGKLVRAGQN